MNEEIERQMMMRKTKKVEPDIQVMGRVLKLLFSNRSFTYQTYGKAEGAQSKWGTLEPGTQAVTKLCQLNISGSEVAVVPNLMDGKGRHSKNCTAIRWMFVDGDTGKHKLEHLLALPVQPNLVVQTSAGHLHPYWRVKGLQVAEFKSVQKALAKLLGEDDTVSDPSRCMRLAGTVNYKRQPPELTRLVYPPLGKYRSKVTEIEDFVLLMGLELEPSATRSTPVQGEEDRHDTDGVEGDGGGGGDGGEGRAGKGDSGVMTVEQVQRHLRCIDPEPRDLWLKVGQALHSRWPDREGYSIWCAWSRQSQKFDPVDQKRTWKQMKQDQGITLGTIKHLAQNELKIPGADERDYADALVKAAAGKLAFDPGTRSWWRFTGTRWETSKGDHQALKFVRAYVDELAELVEPEAVKHLTAVNKMTAAIKQAQLDDRIAVDEKQFDVHPHLLGVRNGVVDLRTGEFRAATAGDMLTKCANVEYQEDAGCPLFQKFMREICMDRKSLYLYLMRALGYTLTGETKEQIFFMPLGRTQNGKGTLLNLLADLLGEYATSVNPMLLMRAYSGNPNAPSPALMKLRGSRMLLCTETQEGKGMDEAFIKQLTGGDKLVGREGYGQQVEFKVTGKLWVSSNHDPEIAYAAEAMWRRIHAIPFDARFSGSSADPDLGAKLAAEGPGILNRLIKHAMRYFANGIPECPEVVGATAALKDRSDTVKTWVDQRCKVLADARVGSSDAHKSYTKLCKSLGRLPLTQTAFRAAMIERGYSHARRNDRNYFFGIGLLQD